MPDDPNQYHRRSIRLEEFDYSSPGVYFVTVVTYHRVRMFGEVVEGEMKLNQFGLIVAQAWEWLPARYPYVILDPYIVMPNHFHGILRIIELVRAGRDPPLQKSTK
jgi:REP element-mobilizing transposase RayT